MPKNRTYEQSERFWEHEAHRQKCIEHNLFTVDRDGLSPRHLLTPHVPNTASVAERVTETTE